MSQDFYLPEGIDGLLTIALSPSVPIGGWSVGFFVGKRFGGDMNLVRKYMSSGFYGVTVSGMDIINSGQGSMKVQINAPDLSGHAYGNYVWQAKRLDSGFITPLADGYIIRTP